MPHRTRPQSACESSRPRPTTPRPHPTRGVVRAVCVGALVSVASLLGACGGEAPATPMKGAYTLRLFAQSFAGRRLELKMREANATATLHHYEGSLDPDGRRDITVGDVLVEGKTYWIDYYVDFDGSGAYTPPGGAGFVDPSWRRILNVTADEARGGRTDSATANDPYFNIAPF